MKQLTFLNVLLAQVYNVSIQTNDLTTTQLSSSSSNNYEDNAVLSQVSTIEMQTLTPDGIGDSFMAVELPPYSQFRVCHKPDSENEVWAW